MNIINMIFTKTEFVYRVAFEDLIEDLIEGKINKKCKNEEQHL